MKADIDYSILKGSLSMSKLLSLEPYGLRKVLLGGLRRGSTVEGMQILISIHLFNSPCSDDSEQLLDHLQKIGWLSFDKGRWRTHFRVP